MKRSIIILVALIVLFAIPVLAEAPEQENAPSPTLDDLKSGLFELSNDELASIDGQVSQSFYDINKPSGGEDPTTVIAIVVNQSGNPNSQSNPGSIPGTSSSVVDTSGTTGSKPSNGPWSDCGASIPK